MYLLLCFRQHFSLIPHYLHSPLLEFAHHWDVRAGVTNPHRAEGWVGAGMPSWWSGSHPRPAIGKQQSVNGSS